LRKSELEGDTLGERKESGNLNSGGIIYRLQTETGKIDKSPRKNVR